MQGEDEEEEEEEEEQVCKAISGIIKGSGETSGKLNITLRS